MRIISGTLKGRRLVTFGGAPVRPTSDKVREALFNILPVAWDGKTVLDLFAGTGALGIEALSRGASHALFVERDVRARQVLEKNITALGLRDLSTVIRFSAEKGIGFVKRTRGHCDVIFLDPPYGMQMAHRTLSLLAEHAVAGRNGIVVVEHHAQESLSHSYGGLIMSDQRTYGKTGISFFLSGTPVR